MSPPISSSVPNNAFSVPDHLTSASEGGSDVRPDLATNQRAPALEVGSHATFTGTGAMTGRMVAVGSGSMRSEVKQNMTPTTRS